jgi:adenylate cyclase class 2
MPEHLEIEVKFGLDNPAPMREALIRAGAVSHGVVSEMNIRLDSSHRQLSQQRVVLRIRVNTAGGHKETLLTVKSPGENTGSAISIRHEYEVSVSDGGTLLEALGVLGYQPYLRYEKRRETLLLADVQIEIDETPVGWFMEMEGAETAIRMLVARLGLDLADALPYSYADLLAHAKDRFTLPTNDFTFQNLSGVEFPPGWWRSV